MIFSFFSFSYILLFSSSHIHTYTYIYTHKRTHIHTYTHKHTYTHTYPTITTYLHSLYYFPRDNILSLIKYKTQDLTLLLLRCSSTPYIIFFRLKVASYSLALRTYIGTDTCCTNHFILFF